MAQILFFLVIVAAAVFTYRRFVADAKKLAERSRQEEKERETGSHGTLVQDPETGEYHLKRDE